MSVASCLIDHLAVTAPSLEAGAALVQRCLGVLPQPGGQHARMGTHNLLLRLGEATYLEIIAIDPQAPPPARPRWFGLDDLAPDAAPRLACWVARTADIRAAAAGASEALGPVEPMSRGTLDWLITIPADGRPPLAGVGPALIEWHTRVHPASGLQDQGCELVGLELLHPQPQRAQALLASLGFAPHEARLSVAEAAQPALRALIRTPPGLRALGP